MRVSQYTEIGRNEKFKCNYSQHMDKRSKEKYYGLTEQAITSPNVHPLSNWLELQSPRRDTGLSRSVS